MLHRIVLVGLGLVAALPALGQTPMGTAFTYQGRLTDAGAPANGIYDLQFTLFTAASIGAQVGPVVTRDDVAVTDGLFTVTLDFGASAFTGSARWLEIGVRPGASAGGFTTLSPRQELTPSPNALYSRAAGTATSAGNVTGVVALTNGGTGASLAATGGPGQYLKQAGVGSAVSVGAIGASDLPAHTHGAGDVVSGTLPIARGGTGQTAYAVNGVVFAGNTNLASTAAGTTGQVLVATTGAAPNWSATTGITTVGTLGSLNVSGTATVGGLSCAGCVGTATLENAAATSPKVNPTVSATEGTLANLAFDTSPANNTRVCALGAYAASTNQRALLDAGIAWLNSPSVTGAVQIVYSTNGGSTWNAVLVGPMWATNPPTGWTNSSANASLNLNAGASYLFAVTGWGLFAFSAIDSRCYLRAVFVAR